MTDDLDVFEYGAGYSTLWWARRARSVRSVESDENWVERLADGLPSNADVHYCALDSDGMYARAAAESGRLFDIIVIDGLDRNNCALRALPALKPQGVVVWDNSDWVHLFGEGLTFLMDNGFSRLDFGGVGPLNGIGWTTSVFYRRNNNCLGV